MSQNLPNSFKIFKETIIFFRRRFFSFFGVIFPIYLLCGLLSGFALEISETKFVLILLIILLPLFAWKNLAIFYIIKYDKSDIKITEPFTKTVNKIAPFCLVYAIVIFSVIGGFILLIIPAIILAIYLSLSLCTYFFEDLKGYDALLRSIEYVKGNWFNVARKGFFLVLVLFLINTLIPFVIYKILPHSFSQLISGLVLDLIINPIEMIFLYLVYQKLSSSHIKNDVNSIDKRKTFLKAISSFGSLSFISLLLFLLIKYPDYFSYKITEYQKQEMIKTKKEHPWAQQIKIRIKEDEKKDQ